MKEIILIIILISMVLGCSQTYRERIKTKPQIEDSIILDIIDSNMVEAAVKPSDYRWNTNGNLVDLLRKKYKPPKIDPNYPNPFSPTTFIKFSIMKSDSISFYFCNTDESSCFKFEGGYYENGNYSLGFQKLDTKPGNYVIKIVTTDTVYSKKILIIPE